MRQSAFWNCLSRALCSLLQPHGLSLQRWRNKANPSIRFSEAGHDLVKTGIHFREQIWFGGGAGRWSAEVDQALASSLVFWVLRREGRAAGGGLWSPGASPTQGGFYHSFTVTAAEGKVGD